MLEFILKYWIEVGFGLIVGLTAFLYRKISHYYEMMNWTKNGVKVLLKDEIIRRYNEIKKEGSLSLFEKEAIIDLYQEYKNLGGNGMIEDVIDDISEIPIVKNHGGD